MLPATLGAKHELKDNSDKTLKKKEFDIVLKLYRDGAHDENML